MLVQTGSDGVQQEAGAGGSLLIHLSYFRGGRACAAKVAKRTRSTLNGNSGPFQLQLPKHGSRAELGACSEREKERQREKEREREREREREHACKTHETDRTHTGTDCDTDMRMHALAHGRAHRHSYYSQFGLCEGVVFKAHAPTLNNSHSNQYETMMIYRMTPTLPLKTPTHPRTPLAPTPTVLLNHSLVFSSQSFSLALVLSCWIDCAYHTSIL